LPTEREENTLMPHGVAIPYWLDRPAGEALEVIAAAQEAGASELWIGEMATFDAFALAAVAAHTTSDLQITVGPLPVTVRDPVAMAMGVSSVAELGGRPAHLALGASSLTVVKSWHGVEAAASTQRFEEVIQVCRSLFAGERADLQGSTLTTSGFRLRIGQAGGTIAVAAFGPRMLRLAAQHADRVVLAHVSPRQVQEVRTLVNTVAAEHHRPAPQLVVWTQTGCGPDAFEQIRRGLVAYVGARGYGEMFAAEGFSDIVTLARSGSNIRTLAATIPDGLVRLVAAVGDIDDVRQAIADRYLAGADRVVVVPATTTLGGTTTLLRDVL
jgi:probable F420-dependent oxidoreductase